MAVKRICSAMKKRGITKFDSPEGAQLCLHCPYPECELDKDQEESIRVRERRRIAIVRWMKLGLDTGQVAQRMGLSWRTTQKYMREEEGK